jgi:hypothetical protein
MLYHRLSKISQLVYRIAEWPCNIMLYILPDSELLRKCPGSSCHLATFRRMTSEVETGLGPARGWSSRRPIVSHRLGQAVRT